MEFNEIKTTVELKRFLDDQKDRLKNCEYLSHYTTYSNLINILKSKKIYLSKAEGMNDLLEFKNGSEDIWDKLYFFSLMMTRKENIGMWAVYSQPWEDGVKLSFKTKDVKELVENLKEIYIVDENEKLTGETIKNDDDEKCFISAVAYTNTDFKEENEKEEVIWNTVENKKMHLVSKQSDLTGYIKDEAWAYEREVRIKKIFNDRANYHRIALDISSLFENMIIETGPLFKGELKQRMERDLEGFNNIEYKIESSIFQNNIKINSIEKEL